MAPPTLKVGILGATGRTGGSVVDGLLESTETKFEITALTRPTSLATPDVAALRARGVRIVAVDPATAPEPELVAAFQGLDVLVSAVSYKAIRDQLRLLGAVKQARVPRFVPCFWGTPAARGEQYLLDSKLDVLEALQRADIPYTTIDVGWWSQQVIPKLPSGRTNHAVFDMLYLIPGDGNVLNALTDVRDIGKWTAKIITDPRTLNRRVLAYTDLLTFNQAYDMMDELSGEKSERVYRSIEDIRNPIAEAKEELKKDPTNQDSLFKLILNQYLDSWGVRAHNTPEYAKYLGFLDVQELYPEGVGAKTVRTLLQEVLEGKPAGVGEIK